MSTRCQIGFYYERPSREELVEKVTAMIYRHSDGYPEGVIPAVMPHLQEIKKGGRLDDAEYCSARLLQRLCNDYDASTEESGKRMGYDVSMYKFTGYGITMELHGDIEYYYAVSPAGIDVYDVSFPDWSQNEKHTAKHFKLIEEHEVDGSAPTMPFTPMTGKHLKKKYKVDEHGQELCPKYNEPMLPDEEGKCSLCGEHEA